MTYECLQCGDCCNQNPGWFAPGEMEKAAEHLSMSTDEFAKNFLIIDSIELQEFGKVEVFAPLRMNKFNEPARPPLTRVDFFYRYFTGRCIFFKDKGCMIYPHRPIECKNYYCSKISGGLDDIGITHEKIAQMWVEQQ